MKQIFTKITNKYTKFYIITIHFPDRLRNIEREKQIKKYFCM